MRVFYLRRIHDASRLFVTAEQLGQLFNTPMLSLEGWTLDHEFMTFVIHSLTACDRGGSPLSLYLEKL